MKIFTSVSLFVFALLCSLTFFSEVQSVKATQEPKITLCHRTNSVTNPYEKITVAASAVDAEGPGNADHLGNHLGPVFDYNNPPSPPHNGDQWGDIIPPFYEDGTPRPGFELNWNSAGQAFFYNGDCDIPTPSVEPSPTPTVVPSPSSEPSPSVTPSPTPGVTPSPTPSATPNPTPEPQVNDVRLSFNCTAQRWNAEVILKRNNNPVSNANIKYEFYGKNENRRTDTNGINNFQFNNEGNGLLKVYPETFNGHEFTLVTPSCNSGDSVVPQTIIARGRVLGASTEPLVYANTGVTSALMSQIALVASVVASSFVFTFVKKSNE